MQVVALIENAGVKFATKVWIVSAPEYRPVHRETSPEIDRQTPTPTRA